MITVEITGPEIVEEASIVLKPAGDGKPSPAFPMLRQSETTFSHQMSRVENDARFYIQTPRGRSEWFNLIVSPVPVLEEVRANLVFSGLHRLEIAGTGA